MNPLYYQYGAGPASMQTPDYQTFLALLEQMRKQNGGDGSGGKSSDGSQGGGMGGLGSLMKMFGGGSPIAGASPMAGSFDTPTGGLGMSGIAGLIA